MWTRGCGEEASAPRPGSARSARHFLQSDSLRRTASRSLRRERGRELAPEPLDVTVDGPVVDIDVVLMATSISWLRDLPRRAWASASRYHEFGDGESDVLAVPAHRWGPDHVKPAALQHRYSPRSLGARRRRPSSVRRRIARIRAISSAGEGLAIYRPPLASPSARPAPRLGGQEMTGMALFSRRRRRSSSRPSRILTSRTARSADCRQRLQRRLAVRIDPCHEPLAEARSTPR